MSKARLNLGAGNRIIKGAVNHDLYYHRDEIDIAWDLNAMPWPWADDMFDEVIALSVLEHLRCSLAESINEVWRITAPDGIARIKLPYWDSEISHNDPTHLHFAGTGIFDQFDQATKRGQEYAFYGLSPWRIISVKLVNEPPSSIVGRLQKVTNYG